MADKLEQLKEARMNRQSARGNNASSNASSSEKLDALRNARQIRNDSSLYNARQYATDAINLDQRQRATNYGDTKSELRNKADADVLRSKYASVATDLVNNNADTKSNNALARAINGAANSTIGITNKANENLWASQNFKSKEEYDAYKKYSEALKNNSNTNVFDGSATDLNLDKLKQSRSDARATRDDLLNELSSYSEEFEKLMALENERGLNPVQQSRKSELISKMSETKKLLTDARDEYGALNSVYSNEAKPQIAQNYVADVMNKSDFNANSDYRATGELDAIGFVERANNGYSPYENIYRLINGEEGIKGLFAEEDMLKYTNMSDEQKKVFNYLYNTNGDIESYLKAIEEDLNYKAAKQKFEESYQGNFLNTGLVNGIGFGLSNSLEGAEGLVRGVTGSDDYDITYNKYLQSLIGNDVKGLNKVLFDTGVSIGNMIPSMTIGALTNPVVGATLMGAGASGNSYNDAIREGKSVGEARTYSAINGALEGGLEYVLGGIGGLSGNIASNAIDSVLPKGVKAVFDKATKNAVSKFALMYGKDMLGEFTEEYLQEVLDPIVKNMVYQENNEVKLVSKDAIYSGILGALTAGILNAPNVAIRSQYASALMEPDNKINLIDEAKSLPENTKAYQLAYAKDSEKMNKVDLLELSDAVSEYHTEVYNNHVKEVKDYLNNVKKEYVADVKTRVNTAYSNIDKKSLSEFNKISKNSEDEASAATQLALMYHRGQAYNSLENTNNPNKEDSNFRSVFESFGSNPSITQEQAFNAWVSGYKNPISTSDNTDIIKKLNTYLNDGKGGLVRVANDEEVKNFGIASADLTKLSKKQRSAIASLTMITKALGTETVLYDSSANHNTEDGFYDKNTGRVYIDINSGAENEQAIMRVASHELTHFIQQNGGESYTNLRDFVRNQISDIKWSEQIEKEKGLLDAKKYKSDEELEKAAEDEVIANACEMMLKNTNAIKKLYEEDLNTFNVIKKWIDGFVAKLHNQFKKLNAEAWEDVGSYENVVTLIDSWDEIQRLWDNALVDASNKYNGIEADTKLDDNGYYSNESAQITDTVFQAHKAAYRDGGRKYLKEWLDNEVSKGQLDKEDAYDVLNQMDIMYTWMQEIEDNNPDLIDYAQWAESEIETDENGNKVLSVIVNNGEYKLNIDMATVCKKRKALDAVLNALVQSNKLSVYTLTESDVSRLNAIIKKHNFEIACALCFVDSKRYRVGTWADTFVNGKNDENTSKYGYNALVESLAKGNNKNASEFNFTGRDIKNPTSNLVSDTKPGKDSSLNWSLIDKVMEENAPKDGKGKNEVYKWCEALIENPELRQKLNASEIVSSIGLDAIRLENPKLYSMLNIHEGTAKPKFSHDSVQYKNDILVANNFKSESAYMVGGVRLQSFSDFMANMVFDYAQMVSELSAKQLPAHAYTKEAIFAYLFGKTGIKINMSLVPKAAMLTDEEIKEITYLDKVNSYKGNSVQAKKLRKENPEFSKEATKYRKTEEYRRLTEKYAEMKKNAGLDGDIYIWEDETFPYDVAMKIQADPEYSKNVGTIAVGVSDNHIRKLMNDPTIQMVIPYHRSGLNHIVAVMRNISLYNDYTNVQNTRDSSGKKLESGDFNFYKALYPDGVKNADGKINIESISNGDAKSVAKQYLDWCKENNYIPKFDAFAYNEDGSMNENYYKLLVDFRMYDNDGNISPQLPVKPSYPDEKTFKDILVNGVEYDGEYHGGLRKSQENSTRLKAETNQIMDEFEKELTKEYGKDVLQKHQRTELSNREVLANALDSAAKNSNEKTLLENYKNRIAELDAKQSLVEELTTKLNALKKSDFDSATEFVSERSRLRAEINSITKTIERVDARLLELEATSALKDVVTRARRDAEKVVSQKYQERAKATVESRTKTETRNQIKKIYDDFNHRLSDPKGIKFVPVELAKQVSELMEVMMDNANNYENQIKNLEQKISEATSPAEIQHYTERIDKIKKYQDNFSQRVNDLSKTYNRYKNDTKYDYFDETTDELIKSLEARFDGKNLYTMSLEDLKYVKDTLNAIKHTIVTAVDVIDNSVHGTDRFGTKTTRDVGRDATKTVLNSTQTRAFADYFTKQGFGGRWINDTLRPSNFFNRISGFAKDNDVAKIYEMLNDGQTEKLKYIQGGYAIFNELLNGTENQKNVKALMDTKNLVTIPGLVDGNGNEVGITRGMMLSIYMHLLNNDNRKHMMYGGLTVPDIKKYYNGNIKESISGIGTKSIRGTNRELYQIGKQLSDPSLTEAEKQTLLNKYKSQLDEGNKALDEMQMYIEDKLTNWEKAYIKAAQTYFDVYSKNAINKTTMALNGFERARVENYFPIHSDKRFIIGETNEGIKTDKSLEHAGYLKDRVFSGNTMYLEDINSVIMDQISSVSDYVGMAIPLRNYNKMKKAILEQNGINENFISAIGKAWGSSASDYLNKLEQDLVGARTSVDKSSIFDKLRGNLAGATLTWNPRVIIGQAASYNMAAAVLGWDAVSKALVRGGQNNTIISKADRDQVAEWTPLLWYRNQGNSTTELGDLNNTITAYGKTKDFLQSHKATKLIGESLDLIQKMDTATVGRIWYAAQYYVQDNYDYSVGSDNYWAEVAKWFNKAVEETQPNYTTLQRPEILRNKNQVMKFLTMYKTQSLQNYNVLYDALGRYNRYRLDYKNGRNGVTEADVKEAGKGAFNAITSVATSNAIYVGMRYLASMLIANGLADFRDDDKELTLESTLKGLGTQYVDATLGMILWGSYISDIAEALATKGNYNGIGISVTDEVTTLVRKINALNSALPDGKPNMKDVEKAWALVSEALKIAGFPSANAEKLVKGAINNVRDMSNGTWFEEGVDRSIAQNVHLYYKAFQDNDNEKMNIMLKELDGKSSAKAQFTKYFKQLLFEEGVNEAEVRKAMLRTGLYDNADAIIKTVNKWKKDETEKGTEQ